MVSAGSIVSGAFRHVRERPLAVIVWGLIYAAVTVVGGFIMAPFYRSAALGTASPLEGAGTMLLFQLVTFVVISILFTASQRAVLRPWEEGVFHIRLGMDELRMIGLALFLTIVTYIGLIVAIVPFTMVAAVVAFTSPAAMAVVMVVGFLAVFAVVVWISVRLSLAYPLTLLRGKIVIGESWRLTRGRFWSLFGGYLALFLILAVLFVATAAVVSGSYIAEMLQSGFDPARMESAELRQLDRELGDVDTLTVFGWLLTIVNGSLLVALGGGAVATAAKDLASDQTALVRDFE